MNLLHTIRTHTTPQALQEQLQTLAHSPRNTRLTLLLLALLLYLPGIHSLPPIDRDEPRYTQASKQMLETGDHTRIYFQEQFRNKKPVGIYWLQSATTRLLGGGAVKDHIWPYRIPSILAAFLTLLLVHRLGTLLLSPPAGLLAALLLSITPLMTLISRVATTDAVLLAATTAALLQLIRAWHATQTQTPLSWRTPLTFWIALAIGILIKGPITPLIVGLTAATLYCLEKRPIRGLRPALGIPLLLTLILPWLISIQLATDGAFLRDSLGADFGKKLISGQESHGAPPGLYTLLTAITAWPLTLLLIPALHDAWKTRKEQPLSRLLLAWTLPYLLLIELVPTKLPHYALSIYPALTLLTVRYLWEERTPPHLPKILHLLHRLYRTLWYTVPPLFTLISLLSILLGANQPLALLTALAFALATHLQWRTRTTPALRRLLLQLPPLIIGFNLLFGALAPTLQTLWISQTVAQHLRQIRTHTPQARLHAVGYHEPSLVFLCGTQTHLTSLNGLRQHLNQYSVCLLPADTDTTGLPLTPYAPINGINYSKGKPIHHQLYIHTAIAYLMPTQEQP